jgi:hypothetical protein
LRNACDNRQGTASNAFEQEVNSALAGIHLRDLRDLRFHCPALLPPKTRPVRKHQQKAAAARSFSQLKARGAQAFRPKVRVISAAIG